MKTLKTAFKLLIYGFAALGIGFAFGWFVLPEPEPQIKTIDHYYNSEDALMINHESCPHWEDTLTILK